MLNKTNEKYSFVLMWCEAKVLSFTGIPFDGALYIESIDEMYNHNLLPVPLKNIELNSETLYKWLKNRCFSTLKRNYNQIIDPLMGMPDGSGYRMLDAQVFVSILSYGVNLTDKYWINPVNTIELCTDINENSYLDDVEICPKTYKEVNFFYTNHISDHFKTAFIDGCYPRIRVTDYAAPDICTNGIERQYWDIVDGKFCLKKIFDICDLNKDKNLNKRKGFLDYVKSINKDIVPECFSLKEHIIGPHNHNTLNSFCVTDKNTELISAYDIVLNNPYDYKGDLLEKLKKNYLALGFDKEPFAVLEDAIKKIEKETNKKIDEYRNIGFIKDINTEKIIKPVIWSLGTCHNSTF